MAWLPHVEKISKIPLFVLEQVTNVTDGQTDRQTPYADIYRAYVYASRGKKIKKKRTKNKSRSMISPVQSRDREGEKHV